MWHTAQPTADDSRRSVKALARGTLMSFQLPGGQFLKDATRAEVTNAAEFFRKQASDMSDKANWLLKIATAMPAKGTVGKTLTKSKLQQFKQEALRHAA